MKALITGGAGFIGSHLAERLLGAGNSVIVVDNLSTGSIENIAPALAFARKHGGGFDFVEGDISDAILMETLAGDCDVIFHLAAAVGVKLIAERPVHTIETNIGGTEVVLDAASKFGRKILIASSSEVYGKSEQVPFDEDDDLVLGSTRFSRWSYACSKAVDEFLGLAFNQQFRLPVVIARFFNTIGPRQTGMYGMVVPRFVQAALKDEPVTIYGTGKQSRCFCYVGDVVEAITALMDCPQAEGGVFNIGSDEEVTVEQLADRIIRLAGSRSRKEYVSYEAAYGRAIDDMMRRVPRLERIKKAIEWQPRTSLEEALKIIITEEKRRK